MSASALPSPSSNYAPPTRKGINKFREKTSIGLRMTRMDTKGFYSRTVIEMSAISPSALKVAASTRLKAFA